MPHPHHEHTNTPSNLSDIDPWQHPPARPAIPTPLVARLRVSQIAAVCGHVDGTYQRDTAALQRIAEVVAGGLDGVMGADVTGDPGVLRGDTGSP
jgi:hypothetical protein